MKGLILDKKIILNDEKINGKWVTVETKKGYFLPLAAQSLLIKENINFKIETLNNSDFEVIEPNPSTFQKIKNFFGL